MSADDICWSSVKDIELRMKRGIGFPELLGSRYIMVMKHPKRDSQLCYLFDCAGYVWVVSFVVGDGHIFLKTAYPSRKYTRLHRKGLL